MDKKQLSEIAKLVVNPNERAAMAEMFGTTSEETEQPENRQEPADATDLEKESGSEEEEGEDESAGSLSNFYTSSSDEELEANEFATFLASGVSPQNQAGGEPSDSATNQADAFKKFTAEIESYVKSRFRYECGSYVVKAQVYREISDHYGLARLEGKQSAHFISLVGKTVCSLSRGDRKIIHHGNKVDGKQVWRNLGRH